MPDGPSGLAADVDCTAGGNVTYPKDSQSLPVYRSVASRHGVDPTLVVPVDGTINLDAV